MPHITVEFSANVEDHHDIAALIEAIHEAALAHGLAAPDALRTRAAKRETFVVADADPNNAFVAIAVRIGPGREPQAKSTFIEHVLDAAEEQVATEVSPLAIAWSIELNEIDPSTRINRNHVRERMRANQGTADG